MTRNNRMATMQKLMEAKKMEAEALMGLLPEQTQEHLKVIGKELKSMIKESLILQEGTRQEKPQKASASGARKVDID